MKGIESRILLDSSAWLAYFLEESAEARDIFEKGKIIFTSILSIFEIKRKLKRMKIFDDKISKAMSFIIHKSIVANLDLEIVDGATRISLEKKLAAIDSLIYSTSLLNNCVLVTGDSDFEGLDKVHVLE